jgi:formylglycine-generating enzyme required for sulfatase activity
MKKFTFVICFLSFFIFQNKAFAQSKDFVKRNKNLVFVPMGTLEYDRGEEIEKISLQAFYMSQEVSNKEYKEFVNDLKNNPTDSLVVINYNSDGGFGKKTYFYQNILASVIDTSFWENHAEYKNYFWDKKYENFPVLGVSFENAQLYCVWKTKKENEYLKSKKKSYINDFRLPREEEIDYVFQSFEYKENNTKGNTFLMETNIFDINELGLFHIDGNASEWVVSKNNEAIVKGSSYKEFNKSFYKKEIKDKNFTDDQTGFRMVSTYLLK